MSDTTQRTPADVRGRIIRASILPMEDEETMIARLRAGAEAVERGELDAEDFAGIWSQYLRELFRRASSVPTPADVRERVAKTVYLWEATRFGAAESWALRSWEQESNTRRELYFNVADRILALLRTPRGERPAGPLDAAEWADLDEAVPLPEPLTDAERAEGLARIRADRMRRTPGGEGEAATTHLIRTAIAVADAAPWRQSPDMDLLKVAVRDHRAASGDPEPTMDVVAVNLHPGDRLVVTLPRPVRAEELEYMRAALQRWAPDVPALILTEGARFAVEEYRAARRGEGGGE